MTNVKTASQRRSRQISIFLTPIFALGLVALSSGGLARTPTASAAPQRQPLNSSTASDAGQTSSSPNWASPGPGAYPDQNGNLVTGRVTAVAVNPPGSFGLFVGSPGGGVWDGSPTSFSQGVPTSYYWLPISDNAPSMAVGALGVDPHNTNVVYVGTGEDLNEGDLDAAAPPPGIGVLRGTVTRTPFGLSTKWSKLGPTELVGRHVTAVVADKTGAVSGGLTQHIVMASDHGLFVSQNAGTSWQTASGTPAKGHFTQVVQDPARPTLWFAAQVNQPSSSSCFAKIWQSTDDGATWGLANGASSFTMPTKGLHQLDAGMGLGIGNVRPGATGAQDWGYATVTDCTGNISAFVSYHPGKRSWQVVSKPSAIGLGDFASTRNTFGQGNFDNVIAVDPTNSCDAVLGATNLYEVTNGCGTSPHVSELGAGNPVHPDIHALLYLGHDHFVVGSDGGAWSTACDGGGDPATSCPTGSPGTWQNLNPGLNLATFYSGSGSHPWSLLGSTQDNGTPGYDCPPPGSPSCAWKQHLGGDGGTAVAVGNTVYAQQDTQLYLSQSGISGLDSGPPNIQPCALSLSVLPVQCQVNVNGTNPTTNLSQGQTLASHFPSQPMLVSSDNPSTVILGTAAVLMSTDYGSHWQAVLNSDGTNPIPNVPSSNYDCASAGPNCSVAVSAMTGYRSGTVPGPSSFVLFVGTNFGSLYKWDGTSWTDIHGNLPLPTAGTKFDNLPWFSSILMNPANPKELWVGIDGHGFAEHLWHTVDGGADWFDLAGTKQNAPYPLGDVSVNSMALGQDGVLYAGTSHGVYYCASSTCLGQQALGGEWHRLGSGLPHAWISWLNFTDDGSSLLAWTYGRGLWETLASSLP